MTIAAIVVDLPDPVGPVTKINPRGRNDISANDAPRSSHFDNVRLVRRDVPSGIDTPPQADVPPLHVYPNPFNPGTTVTFTVTQTGPVTLSVYDVGGRLVERLIEGRHFDAGEYQLRYEPVGGSGVYFLRLETAGPLQVSKILLLK